MRTKIFIALLLLLPTLSWATAPDFVALTKELKPAVVNISTSKKVRSLHERFERFNSPRSELFDDFFEHFFRGQTPPHLEQKSLGSGFIISEDGYILTNGHVVDNADEITIQLSGGKTYPAAVKGVDQKLDLALLKIDTDEKLPVVKLGNSERLEIGEWVMAIGNPFGLDQTVTVGIVSAKGRVIGAGPYDNFIQTDASINPGNSGGPLFNTRGEVVGINTAIVAHGQGIGFAIPVNAAKTILPQLKETGHVTRGWLGVSIQQVSENLATSFGLESTDGALVSSVTDGSPADRAGVKRGDIILTLNRLAIKSMHDLPRMVAEIPIGETAELTLYRDGTTINATVKIGKMEEGATETKADATGEKSSMGRLGLSTQDLTSELRQRWQISAAQGAVIIAVDIDSPAAQATLQPGDVIVEFNGRNITGNSDLQLAVKETFSRPIQRLLIQRGQGLFFVALKINP
ncbi:MAG: DegQ family serine endoprotease [Desulfuromonadaceae bacterium]|nr:DegQ family serine endoprotease [Desulfuromonadaceae bacterium]